MLTATRWGTCGGALCASARASVIQRMQLGGVVVGCWWRGGCEANAAMAVACGMCVRVCAVSSSRPPLALVGRRLPCEAYCVRGVCVCARAHGGGGMMCGACRTRVLW